MGTQTQTGTLRLSVRRFNLYERLSMTWDSLEGNFTWSGISQILRIVTALIAILAIILGAVISISSTASIAADSKAQLVVVTGAVQDLKVAVALLNETNKVVLIHSEKIQ